MPDLKTMMLSNGFGVGGEVFRVLGQGKAKRRKTRQIMVTVAAIRFLSFGGVFGAKRTDETNKLHRFINQRR